MLLACWGLGLCEPDTIRNMLDGHTRIHDELREDMPE